MSFSQLEDHLWSQILDHLAPTIPEPLAGLTKQEAVVETQELIDQLPEEGAPGVATRQAIKAPELAALMRTSIAFNRLAARPLYYHTIITDRFPALIRDVYAPSAHPQIESKAQLLSHTRGLRLEYRPKGVQPTYTSIMSDWLYWEHVIGEPVMAVAMSEAVLEISTFSEAQKALGSAPKPTRPLFPKVTRLSIGATFGSQDMAWTMLSQDGTESEDVRVGFMRDMIAVSQHATLALFGQCPITHFCQRGYAGPLSLPQAFHWADHYSIQPPPTIPMFNMHFSLTSDGVRVPAAIGSPTRWLQEHPLSAPDILKLFQLIPEAVCDVADIRDNHWRDAGVRRDKRINPTLKIAVYGSSAGLQTSFRLPGLPNERGLIDQIDSQMRGERRGSRSLRAGEEDEIVWRDGRHCPSCEACGWIYKP